MLLALIDAAGFRHAAQLSETEFAAALIAGLLPPAVGLVNGVPHWSKDQATSFIEHAEREVLQRHSHLAEALISGASEVRSTPTRSAPKTQPEPKLFTDAPTVERPINEPHDDERLDESMSADYLGMSTEVLRLAREGGTGPAWTKNGSGKIIYRFGDLRAFKHERDRIDTHARTDRPNLDVRAAAAYCGYTVETFKSFTKPSNRMYGKGPAFLKVTGAIGHRGGRLEFRPDDLDAWLREHHKGAQRHIEQGTPKAPPKPKPEKPMTAKQAAKYLKVSESSLGYFRQSRDHNRRTDHGPAYTRDAANRVFYMRSDLDAWKEKRGDAIRVMSPEGKAVLAANVAKARAKRLANLAREKKANRVTVGEREAKAESEERSRIVERIEACGKQAEAFPLNDALTHGKATIGQKVVLKAGTTHAHSRMPIVPASD